MTRVVRIAVSLALLGGVAGGIFWAREEFGDRTTLVASVSRQDPSVQAQISRPMVAPNGGTRTVVDETWVVRSARAAGIPPFAVRAYARATLSAPKGCELGWTTLAGIGWVESQHGTIGGRSLGADGRSSRTILGPALDGVGLAAIRATPGSTAMHGNLTWDHAVGPMQFIPSSWRRWARDGDGDGVRDPHDLDDAAAAAAAYLCHDQHDLTSSQGWNAAIFSYNHDNGYVVAVHDAAHRYGLALG